MEKVYPIPEAVDGEAWEVRVGVRAKTVKGEHLMEVPLSTDPHDIFVRTHEMAHAKWSPADQAEIPKDIPGPILQAVEDARVNSKATMLYGVDMTAGYDPLLEEARIAQLVRTKDYENLVLMAIGTMGTGSFSRVAPKVLGVLKTEKKRYATMLKTVLDKAAADPLYAQPFSYTIDLSRFIHKTLTRIRKEEEQDTRRREVEAQAQLRRPGVETKAREKFEEELREQGRARLEEALPDYWASHGSYRFEYTPDGVPKPFDTNKGSGHFPWGEMHIEEPPLVNRLPGRMGRRRRPSDFGAALAYPERVTTDFKVFGRRLPSLGGSVLIDGSGSMSLTPAQVLAILKAAPGCTVAVYSSDGGSSGVLRILAKRGMYVDKGFVRAPAGGGNVIDLPALMWLAKLDEPRIWVSDGHVTAIKESISMANWAEAHIFAIRARILRLPHADPAIKHLQEIQRRRMGILRE